MTELEMLRELMEDRYIVDYYSSYLDNIEYALIHREKNKKELKYAEKCHSLEEELGCPLEVAVDILSTLKKQMTVDIDLYDDGDSCETFEFIDFNGQALQFKDAATEKEIIKWLEGNK